MSRPIQSHNDATNLKPGEYRLLNWIASYISPLTNPDGCEPVPPEDLADVPPGLMRAIEGRDGDQTDDDDQRERALDAAREQM